MGDWPNFPSIRGAQEVIAPVSDCSVGVLLLALMGGTTVLPAAAAWPATNRALFVPFRLSKQFLVTQAVVGCGGTGGGNFDVGVYDQNGNRIVSSGATGRSASSEVVADLADTLIGPGTYYMGLAVDGTNNMIAWAPAAVGLCKALGMKEMASAYTLPDPVTFATVSSAYVPTFSLWGTSL